jgi:hypothetical protein
MNKELVHTQQVKRAKRVEHSTILVVPNFKEVQHLPSPLSLHGILWESSAFTFQVNGKWESILWTVTYTENNRKTWKKNDRSEKILMVPEHSWTHTPSCWYCKWPNKTANQCYCNPNFQAACASFIGYVMTVCLRMQITKSWIFKTLSNNLCFKFYYSTPSVSIL